MASLGMTFDANSVAPAEPRAEFTTLPAGKYAVQIVQSEMREARTGNGRYLWLEMDVVDGEFAGRKLWDRLNLISTNPQAAEIAQRTLSAICHATGQATVSDSEMLHMKPLTATVKVRPAGPDRQGVHREAQNEIRGYEAKPGGMRAAPAARPQAPAPAAVAAAAPAGNRPPWQRG